MMKIDLGQGAQLLGNIGIIVGIVFLVIEVRQNQASIVEANVINRAGSVESAQAGFRAFRSLVVQDEELTEIWFRGIADEDLSEVEENRFRLERSPVEPFLPLRFLNEGLFTAGSPRSVTTPEHVYLDDTIVLEHDFAQQAAAAAVVDPDVNLDLDVRAVVNQ